MRDSILSKGWQIQRHAEALNDYSTGDDGRRSQPLCYPMERGFQKISTASENGLR